MNSTGFNTRTPIFSNFFLSIRKRLFRILTSRKGLVYAVGVDGILRRGLSVGGLRGHVESRHGGRRQGRQRAIQRLPTACAYRQTREVVWKGRGRTCQYLCKYYENKFVYTANNLYLFGRFGKTVFLEGKYYENKFGYYANNSYLFRRFGKNSFSRRMTHRCTFATFGISIYNYTQIYLKPFFKNEIFCCYKHSIFDSLLISLFHAKTHQSSLLHTYISLCLPIFSYTINPTQFQMGFYLEIPDSYYQGIEPRITNT